LRSKIRKKGETVKTITGKPLLEAFAELNKQLESNAYKEITGGKGGKLGLTDIKPAYLPEQLLELFGPYGYGWGFDLIQMKTIDRQVKRNAGYEETEYVTTCTLGCWYRFEVDGVIHKSDHMLGTGGSDNTQIEWAEKGALTSAIGTAWFFAGYQLDVYKGLRSHKKTSGGTAPQGQSTTPDLQPSTTMAVVNQQLHDDLAAHCLGDTEKMDTLLKRLSHYTDDNSKEYSFGLDRLSKTSEKWAAKVHKALKAHIQAEAQAAATQADIPF